MSSWGLRRCKHQLQGMVKVWKDTVQNTVFFLFDNPHDMADIFIIGMPSALLALSEEGGRLRAVLHELSEEDWKTIWEDPNSEGKPFPVHKLIDDPWVTISHTFPPAGGGSASENSAQGGGEQGGEGGQQGGGDDSGSDNGGEQQRGGGGQQGGSNGGGQQPSLLNADNTLEITLLLRDSQPGQGICAIRHDQPILLPPVAGSGCALSSSLVFTFSEVVQPQPLQHLNAKIMELSVSSCFDLAGHSLLMPIAEGKYFKVGVMHDQLKTKIGCSSSPNAFLILNAEATNLSSLNVQSKMLSTDSNGSIKAIQLGANHIVTGQGSSQWTSSVAHTHEQDEGRDLPVVKGTLFIVVDSSDRTRLSSPNDILSFTALHRPPLIEMDSTVAAGLPLMPSTPCPTALGCSTRVSFVGKCLLDGRDHEDYFVELQRCVAEFTVAQETLHSRNKKGKAMRIEEEMALAKQTHKVHLVINHGYSVLAYKGGRLHWRFFGPSSQSPFPDVMHMRA